MSKNDLSAPVSPLPFCPKTQKMQFAFAQIAFSYPKPYQISISLQDASYIPAFPRPRRIRRPLWAARATRRLPLKGGWGENLSFPPKESLSASLHSPVPAASAAPSGRRMRQSGFLLKGGLGENFSFSRKKSFPPETVPPLSYNPISFFTSANLETANLRSSMECAALTCVRMRALPCGTTG